MKNLKGCQLSIWLLVLSMTIAESCQKPDTEPGMDPVENPAPLLKKVTYSDQSPECLFFYHPDSTLQQIYYDDQSGSGPVTHFYFEHRQVKQVHASNSLYYNTYQYYPDGKIRSMLRLSQVTESSGYLFEYFYTAAGLVSEMKYYQVQTAGNQLLYTNRYFYNDDQELVSIRSSNNNHTIHYQMEAYSGECRFYPWAFISTEIRELYQLFNYPVLKQMKRLPARIVRRVAVNAATPVTDSIFAYAFTVNNKVLEKVVSTVQYPADPSANSRLEAVYTYY